MKKHMIMVLAGIGIAAGAAALWFLSRPERLGNINHSFSAAEPVTDRATISFSAREGDRIRFHFSSNVEKGDLEIVLYDSEGNQVEELDQAKELVTYLTMRYDDNYTLAAEYMNFVGNFKVDVTRAE